RDSAGNLVPGTVSYDDEQDMATFLPNTSLNPGTTYTATVDGAEDLAGNVMAAPYSWSFSTAFALVGSTIFAPSAIPAVGSVNCSVPIEVGVKFRADVPGVISGLRFYKGPANTGTHIGNLWSANGELLATATFTGESASGWQQVNFSTPVT